MEKQNGYRKLFYWLIGIFITISIMISGFFLKSSYQDLRAGDEKLEQLNTKHETRIENLEDWNMVMDAKLNLLLLKNGYSKNQIKEIENQFKQNIGMAKPWEK